jgi:hypothetical protein
VHGRCWLRRLWVVRGRVVDVVGLVDDISLVNVVRVSRRAVVVVAAVVVVVSLVDVDVVGRRAVRELRRRGGGDVGFVADGGAGLMPL